MVSERETPQTVSILAEATELGGGDASGLPIRLTRYAKAHRRSLAVADYARSAGHVKMADKLKACGDWLAFRDYYTIGKVRLHAANHCDKHLLCPLCAIRRGARMLRKYAERVNYVRHDRPELHAYLVTFTVKNGDDLGERFRHLQSSIQSLNKTRHGKGQTSALSDTQGAVWSYEIKRGQGSGLWHPHCHMVVLTDTPPDSVRLSDDWKRITGDSHMVDVRPFHDQQDLIGGFLEVFKYAVKFSDMVLPDQWHAFEVLRSRRLISAYGLLYGVEIPEGLADDELLDDLPYVEMFYRYTSGGYSLTHSKEYKPCAIVSQQAGHLPPVAPTPSLKPCKLPRPTTKDITPSFSGVPGLALTPNGSEGLTIPQGLPSSLHAPGFLHGSAFEAWCSKHPDAARSWFESSKGRKVHAYRYTLRE